MIRRPSANAFNMLSELKAPGFPKNSWPSQSVVPTFPCWIAAPRRKSSGTTNAESRVDHLVIDTSVLVALLFKGEDFLQTDVLAVSY
jgi:hypothetical protein